MPSLGATFVSVWEDTPDWLTISHNHTQKLTNNTLNSESSPRREPGWCGAGKAHFLILVFMAQAWPQIVETAHYFKSACNWKMLALGGSSLFGPGG